MSLSDYVRTFLKGEQIELERLDENGNVVETLTLNGKWRIKPLSEEEKAQIRKETEEKEEIEKAKSYIGQINFDIYTTKWTDKEYQDLKEEWDSVSEKVRIERLINVIDYTPKDWQKTLAYKLLQNYKNEIAYWRFCLAR